MVKHRPSLLPANKIIMFTFSKWCALYNDDYVLAGKVDKLIKETMKALKKIEGHFILNIDCEKDLSKYLKSMRNTIQKSVK